MRVAFFGSTRFSCNVLSQVLESRHEVVAVVTQPDQHAGRKMKLCPTALCSEAGELGVPILKPERIRGNPEFRRTLGGLKPDCLLVASYGQIISKKVLDLVEWRLNVHPSPLPRLRGAAPVRHTLLSGMKETECCIMQMTPRLDDGDVLLRQVALVPDDVNFESLALELAILGGDLAVQAMDAVENGSVTLTPQDHSQATYSALYTRTDTHLDWSRTTQELHNFIRAWDPDIGSLAQLPDGRRLKIWKAAKAMPEGVWARALREGLKPGDVAVVQKQAFWVVTGDGVIRIDEVQPESKQRMTAQNFLAGNTLNRGDSLSVQPE